MAKPLTFRDTLVVLCCDICGYRANMSSAIQKSDIGVTCPECTAVMLTEQDYNAHRRIMFWMTVLHFFGLAKPVANIEDGNMVVNSRSGIRLLGRDQ